MTATNTAPAIITFTTNAVAAAEIVEALTVVIQTNAPSAHDEKAQQQHALLCALRSELAGLVVEVAVRRGERS